MPAVLRSRAAGAAGPHVYLWRGLGQQPQRGARVIAPFRNEKLIGVVTAVDVAAPPADVEVRYLEAVLDEEPLLSDHLLELAEWTAQYYLAPLGEVLRAMLPLTAEVQRTVYYRMTDLGRDVLAQGGGGGFRGFPPISAKDAQWMGQQRWSGQSAGRVSREDAGHGAAGAGAAEPGEPVKVSTLRTATAATVAGAGRRWCARSGLRARQPRQSAMRAGWSDSLCWYRRAGCRR